MPNAMNVDSGCETEDDNLIDLTGDDEVDGDVIDLTGDDEVDGDVIDLTGDDASSARGGWACMVCQNYNDPRKATCDVCNEPRFVPRAPPAAKPAKALNDECPICFQTLSELANKERVSLKCNHAFCQECIDKSLAHHVRDGTTATCPLCRFFF